MTERDALGRRKPEYKRRQPATISTEERDRRIVELHRRGMSHSQIAKDVSMTKSGVSAAIKRCTQPGSRLPGDTDNVGDLGEQW